MARQIALCGFADSKSLAPWQDPSWEKWAVNDLYAYVPPGSVQRVFEVHHQIGLQNRRNPNHDAWMRQTAPQLGIPIVMQEHRPEYPTSIPIPRMEIAEVFADVAFGGRAGCDYFTNSVAWMIAMALLELSEWVSLPDGRRLRLCPPGTKLHLFGIDMAAGAAGNDEMRESNSEYAAQRPSCEFWLGVAKSMGCELYVPDNSDLLKAPALYGFDTSAPLRVKMQGRIAILREQKMQIIQQRNMLQQQIMEAEKALSKIDGSVDMARYVQGVWTMPTDIGTGEVTEAKLRTPVEANGHSEQEQVIVGG